LWIKWVYNKGGCNPEHSSKTASYPCFKPEIWSYCKAAIGNGWFYVDWPAEVDPYV